jgi:beta-glucosidase/6-phospho-beta-glucosidase/beta-galactosidase
MDQLARSSAPGGPGLFPTFFLSGFECSTFLWKDRARRDLSAETRHRQHVLEDYQILHDLGIGVAREGIPWPLVDGRTYDFSLIDGAIEALNQCQMLPIWDLCHYGYPDDADPFDKEFVDRFVQYCRAAAEYVVPRVRGPHFFTPINEITFFAFAGGNWGWVAPYLHGRENRQRLRLRLCEAAIAGTHAIRQVDPTARMVTVDPLVQVVAPLDRPDLQQAAWEETYVDTFYAWDVLAGRRHPELGGAPEVLDIVGLNCYSFGQMEYRGEGPHAAMEPDDPRIVPLCDLMRHAWDRYRRPMIVAETSGLRGGRAAWLKDVVEESLAAVAEGMDLHGVCLFPAVDMPDWHTGEWLHNGLCDLVERDGDLARVPSEPYIAELRRWQEILNRVTVLDEDPFSDPVDLGDVVAAALRYRFKPDADWT